MVRFEFKRALIQPINRSSLRPGANPRSRVSRHSKIKPSISCTNKTKCPKPKDTKFRCSVRQTQACNHSQFEHKMILGFHKRLPSVPTPFEKACFTLTQFA